MKIPLVICMLLLGSLFVRAQEDPDASIWQMEKDKMRWADSLGLKMKVTRFFDDKDQLTSLWVTYYEKGGLPVKKVIYDQGFKTNETTYGPDGLVMKIERWKLPENHWEYRQKWDLDKLKPLIGPRVGLDSAVYSPMGKRLRTFSWRAPFSIFSPNSYCVYFYGDEGQIFRRTCHPQPLSDNPSMENWRDTTEVLNDRFYAYNADLQLVGIDFKDEENSQFGKEFYPSGKVRLRWMTNEKGDTTMLSRYDSTGLCSWHYTGMHGMGLTLTSWNQKIRDDFFGVSISSVDQDTVYFQTVREGNISVSRRFSFRTGISEVSYSGRDEKGLESFQETIHFKNGKRTYSRKSTSEYEFFE